MTGTVEKAYLVHEVKIGGNVKNGIADAYKKSIEENKVVLVRAQEHMLILTPYNGKEVYDLYEGLSDHPVPEMTQGSPEFNKKLEETIAGLDAKNTQIKASGRGIDQETAAIELKLDAPTSWKRRVSSHKTNDTEEYAARWGKLMQMEMQKQGTDTLTKAIFDSTAAMMAEAKPAQANHYEAEHMLVMYWKNGQDLAKFTYPENELPAVAKTREVYAEKDSPRAPTPQAIKSGIYSNLQSQAKKQSLAGKVTDHVASIKDWVVGKLAGR